MHHVSALSRDIGGTHDFFTRVLGMRLVLRTVNQDDPRMYHLFFGDAVGSPGSDFTVFDMPRAVRERRGNNSISLSTFRVGGEPTLRWWADRFDELAVAHAGLVSRDGRAVLEFEDAQGTQLCLVDDGATGVAHAWCDSPVPAEHQIRGLGYCVITVPALEPTDDFLTEALAMRRVRSYDAADASGTVHVYAMAADGPRAELHVRVRADLPRARYGAGGVHHLALRVPRSADIAAWAEHLTRHGHRHSGVIDRHYFRSLYVREPNDVLIELATDGPGLDVDVHLDGNRLALPPAFEAQRVEIEAALPPLRVHD